MARVDQKKKKKDWLLINVRLQTMERLSFFSWSPVSVGTHGQKADWSPLTVSALFKIRFTIWRMNKGHHLQDKVLTCNQSDTTDGRVSFYSFLRMLSLL